MLAYHQFIQNKNFFLYQSLTYNVSELANYSINEGKTGTECSRTHFFAILDLIK